MLQQIAENNPAVARLFSLLNEMNITVEAVEHPAVHTVDEAMTYWSKLEGAHTKNLFLKDANGKLWLICLPSAQRANLKAMAQQLGAKRFSFASAELLKEKLGVEQGAVSPLALVNDTEGSVQLVLDEALVKCPKLTFHPLVNTATVAIATADFLALLSKMGRSAKTIALIDLE